jgi:hypothetical protein
VNLSAPFKKRPTDFPDTGDAKADKKSYALWVRSVPQVFQNFCIFEGMIATHTNTRQKPAVSATRPSVHPLKRHVVLGDLDFGMLDEVEERFIRDMAQLAKEGKGVTMPKSTGPSPLPDLSNTPQDIDFWGIYEESRADRF